MHKNRMFLRRIRKILPCFLTCLLLISWVMPTAAQNTSVSRKIVKAGFFSADGYHNQDDDGMRSGYGYDFLKMAENYSNWKFNFVGYELGWSDMLDMLDSGEIDLLTFAQKNPEREEKYDFSDKPIGTGSIMITVKKGDTRYSDMDAETWNGIRVGIQTGATHEEAMQEYASKQGFTFEPVYYNTLDELKEALQEGKDIDAAIGSSMRPLYNETKVAEMEPIDFYVMVKKGNTVLLNQINEAISQMDMNSPSWRTELKDKYFANTDEEEFMFTQDSKAYLEQLKEDKKVFTVVTNPDLAPYSYFEDGQAKGIAPQVFKRIADSIGLEYQMYSFDTYEEYNAFVREGKADIDLTCFRDYGLAADHGVDLSSAYLTTSLAMLTLDTYDGNLSSIAELKSVGHNTTYTDELLDTVKSEYYDTHGECVDAVLEGKVDATYLYTYTAQKAVEEDVKNRLMYSIMPEYTVELAFGVQEDEDYRLMEILNEGIRCIKGTYIQHVIQNEISDIAEKDSVISLIYDYPELSLGILGAFIVTLFIIGVFVFRSVNEKKRQQQAKELSRFMGYVCEANETVLEVNLDKSTCLLHSMENGILISRDASYMIGQFQNIDEIMHPDDFKRLKKELQVENIFDIFTKQKNGLYFEARGKDKDGEYCWYSYTIRVIPKDRNHPNNFIPMSFS
ncbi:MAG: transporter substrate-binding domain-containing protein [Lachnospiraceae bacterium]|nr:transporter substrate-binding domain-containing protein [Lachnospiraceae bacterium]